MKKQTALFFSLITFALLAYPSFGQVDTVTILHVNDTHSNLAPTGPRDNNLNASTAKHSSGVIDMRRSSMESRSVFFGMVEKVFGLICHQDPSSLMIIDGKQVPLCPRCSGLHLGFLISFVVVSMVVRDRIVFREKSNRFILMVAVALTGVHWSLGQFGLAEPGAMSRLMTGLITGAALGITLRVYRRDLIPPLTTQTVTFDIARTVGVIGISSLLGFIVSNLDSWIALTTIIFFSVLINAIVIIQTSALLLIERKLYGAQLQSTNI